MKRHIIMLSAAILLTGTLAACTGTSKTECWRPNNTKASKDCNSGGSGVSISNPGIKGKLSKRSNTKDTVASPNPDTPQNPDTNHGGTNQNNPDQENLPTNNNNTPPDIPDQDNSPVNDGDAGQNIPDQDNDEGNPNQSNSNDIPGYDPLTDGLYGPGT